MKRLCCSSYILFVLFMSASLFASLTDKSAIVYYGKDISYSMVGIHNYIIVKPEYINAYSHGFSVYKNKIYARVLLDNASQDLDARVDKLAKDGYVNLYFDADTENLEYTEIDKFIYRIKKKYPSIKFIFNFKLKETAHFYDMAQAVVVDSSSSLQKNELVALKQHAIDIIKIQYMSLKGLQDSTSIVNTIKAEGMIPYVSNSNLNVYGVSSKNAIKREILTLIDEDSDDRIVSGAHVAGAVPLEYLGYVQKLYNIDKGLPNIELMRHYAGVVIWLNNDYEYPKKLVRWVLDVNKIGVKVAFAHSFGFNADDMLLNQLDIKMSDSEYSIENKLKIVHKDSMMGFENEPPSGESSLTIEPNNAKALLTYEDSDKVRSTPAAITAWGGYAVSTSFIIRLADDDTWVIDPFKFFAEALRLKKLVVPDTTTENGNRFLFSHVDGDGIISRAESNPELFAGDMILEKILKVYKIPHSISVIGAEIAPNGIEPQNSDRMLKIVRAMYALDNVEAASHTFTHPFYWKKIKNDNLDEKYRLKPKGYHFSLDNELSGFVDYIEKNLLPEDSNKSAHLLFWSGDCAPRYNALSHVYENRILNMNGGDTTISNVSPFLARVAPIGLARDDYYQIYTGAQNENVFTNDWLGPFWGFKRVVQTFKLTNSPKRLKPIDVYYHLYSGSKPASLNALKYIFDWSMKQDVLPIFTSEYIPKAMDYFIVSIANDGDQWLVDGMRNLKTLRVEDKDKTVSFDDSKTVVGVKHFENHTYISLDSNQKHLLKMIDGDEDSSYLIASNAKVVGYKRESNNQQMEFNGHVDLNVSFHVQKGCQLESAPKESKVIYNKQNITLIYNNVKKATVNVICR